MLKKKVVLDKVFIYILLTPKKNSIQFDLCTYVGISILNKDYVYWFVRRKF